MKTIESLYHIFKQYPLVSTDSRDIKPSSIFFSLKGEHFNGNLFAEQSLNNGAAIAVIDDSQFKKDERYIVVADTLKALQLLSQYHRKHLNIPVIGITGTNGKTTTKELLKAVLSRKYKTHATQGNLNNHIGVPLTILSLTKEIEMAVVEMGANHIGEIKELCEIARPTHGIITNIGKAHLEGFGSYEGVIRTKTELYQYLQQNKGGIIVNYDNGLLMEYASASLKYTYGTKIESDCIGELLSCDPFLNLKWRLKESAKFNQIQTQLVGRYNFENVMSAIAVGNYFNVDAASINAAVQEYVPTNNRSQVIKTSTNTLLMDAYNANPSSMKAAITNFASMKVNNKVVILGDMMELGNDSEKEHQQVLDLLMSFQFPYVILVGNYFKKLSLPNFVLNYSDTEKAMQVIKNNPVKNSTVLIKGSRKLQLEKLLEVL
jgi:UDP-N-acetylmuramoyl-tripeptide--D-alanyl-D-alanine ligase